MLPVWAKGALRDLFGIQADTRHWAAVRTLMEQSLGPIKIDVPIGGGKVFAFFEKQTLIGDDTARKTYRHTHCITHVDMQEAVGTGISAHEAVVNLWDKMTKLRPHETILRLDEEIHHGEPHALYTCFRFKRGQFVNQGATSNELPPARPDHIETFLEDEKQHRTRVATDRQAAFARTPSGSET